MCQSGLSQRLSRSKRRYIYIYIYTDMRWNSCTVRTDVFAILIIEINQISFGLKDSSFVTANASD